MKLLNLKILQACCICNPLAWKECNKTSTQIERLHTTNNKYYKVDKTDIKMIIRVYTLKIIITFQPTYFLKLPSERVIRLCRDFQYIFFTFIKQNNCDNLKYLVRGAVHTLHTYIHIHVKTEFDVAFADQFFNK